VQGPTSSELLSLILKEQARLAEISATKKRRRKNAEDLPGSSNPAKKSKLGPSTDLSAVNTGLPSTSHPPGPQTSAYPAVPAPPLTYQQVSSSSKTGRFSSFLQLSLLTLDWQAQQLKLMFPVGAMPLLPPPISLAIHQTDLGLLMWYTRAQHQTLASHLPLRKRFHD
jgi:hypothetical protein